MFERWRSTVRTLMYSREAISSLFSPLATNSSTSSSRLLNAGNSGGPGAIGWARKAWNSARKLVPGRLVGQEDVVAGLERQHSRSRKQRSEDPALFERHHPVVAGMSHEGIHRHTRDELADIDGGAGLIQPDSGLRRRRSALELVVPGHLLLASLGQEEHREEMAERRIRVGPACADDGDQSFVSLALAFAPAQPSSRVAAVEDEPLDSFGMTSGIGDGCRRPLRYPEQHEPVDPGGVSTVRMGV